MTSPSDPHHVDPTMRDSAGSVSEALEAHALEAPGRLAIVDERDDRLSYGQLRIAVRAGASWLGDRGVAKGDRIVIALPNSIDYAVAYLAASARGAVAVAMSARESGADIRRAAETTAASLVLVPTGQRGERIIAALADSADSLQIATVGAAAHEPEAWPGWRALASAPTGPGPAPRDADDLDFIVFSSGTTGTPKGIAHTVGGAAASVWDWNRTLAITWRDGVIAPATFAHVGGLQWGLRTAIAAGARLVIMDRWDPAVAADLIHRYGCTYTLVTPTYIADMVGLPPEQQRKTAGFRLWTVGGSRMSPEFVERAEAALGGRVLRGFGMSEAFMLTITRPDDPPAARLHNDGRALPGCELQIRDERGATLPPGTPGELYVRSVSLVGGYFTDPEQTAEMFVDGWFRTGDIATVTDAGFLTITDRKKELVIRGGENISPQEVEQVLTDFLELPPFAVTGVPDDRLGEKVAFVHEGNPEIGVDRLRALLESTTLAKYKWPEVTIAVTALPRTALGKVQRGALRTLAARTMLGAVS